MLTFIAVVALIIAVGVLANWKLHFFKWHLKDELTKEIASNLKTELSTVVVKTSAAKKPAVKKAPAKK